MNRYSLSDGTEIDMTELHVDPDGNWYPVDIPGPQVCADSTTLKPWPPPTFDPYSNPQEEIEHGS